MSRLNQGVLELYKSLETQKLFVRGLIAILVNLFARKYGRRYQMKKPGLHVFDIVFKCTILHN